MTEQQEPVRQAAVGSSAELPADRAVQGDGLRARHRQHVFPGRGLVVKARYTEDEQAAVARAAALTRLRPAGFVATAALLVARALAAAAGEEDDAQVCAGQEGGEADGADAARAPVLGGRPVVVAWSAGENRQLLVELIQARLALRRYAVNVNQAVAALNSGGQAPVWLEQAVAGSDRAVARVDEATVALTRRLV